MHLRLALLSAHYRSQMNFTWDTLAQAKKNFEKITSFVSLFLPSDEGRNPDVSSGKRGVSTNGNKQQATSDEKVHTTDDTQSTIHAKETRALEQKFWSALDDDLNTPLALSVLYELITYTNAHKNEIPTDTLLSIWNRMNAVLGLILPADAPSDLPEEIRTLVNERDTARAEKNFALSDSLRTKIEALGYIVEDSMEGTKVKLQ
jgi:cysteinyl-tRNA synthetase